MTIRQAALILQAMPVGRKAQNERTQEWEKLLLENSCGAFPARMLLCLLLGTATMLVSSRQNLQGLRFLDLLSSKAEFFPLQGQFPPTFPQSRVSKNMERLQRGLETCSIPCLRNPYFTLSEYLTRSRSVSRPI